MTAIGGGVLFGGAASSAASGALASSDAVPGAAEGELSPAAETPLEAVHLDTGLEFTFESIEAVSPDELPPGEYEFSYVEETEDDIVDVTERVTVSEGALEVADDGPVLFASWADRSYEPDGEITVWLSAYEEVDGVPTEVDGAEIDVELTDPDDEVVASETVTIDGVGAVTTLDLDTVEGDHTLSGEWEAEEITQQGTVRVGSLAEFAFPSGPLTPNEEAAIAVNRTRADDPDPGETDFEVTYPDGDTETVSAEINDGGVGLVEFTAGEEGPHTVDHPDADFGRTVDAREYRVFTPEFEIRDQLVDDPLVYAGHLVGADLTPVAGETVELRLLDSTFGGDVVQTETATTSAFGQFQVEFDAVDETGSRGLELVVDPDGEAAAAHLRADRIQVIEEIEPEPSPSVSVDIDAPFRVVPGADVGVEIEVTDADGEPVPDAEVTITELVGFGFRSPLIGLESGTTDGDGRISYGTTVPTDYIEDERLTVEAFASVDDEQLSGDDGVTVVSFEVRRPSTGSLFGISPGESFDAEFSVEEVGENGDPVEGYDVGVVLGRDYLRAGYFTADAITTGADGTGSVELALPEDLRYGWRINDVARPYSEINTRGPVQLRPFDVSIDVPEEVIPGETLEVEYAADTDADVSAVVVFDTAFDAQVAIAEPGDSIEFDVPAHSAGQFEQIAVVVIDGDGDVVEESEFFSVEDEEFEPEPDPSVTAAFDFTPEEPDQNEEVSFDAGDSEATDTSIESYAWDFTGDGETDATGETATHAFEEFGSNDVELTVTGEDGETDSTTRTVFVQVDPDAYLDEIADDEGEVGLPGLNQAFSDWQGGNIDIQLLSQAFVQWQSGDPLE